MQNELAAPPQEPAATPQAEAANQREVKPFTLPPEKYQKAIEYSRQRYALYFVSFVWGLGVLLLVLHRRWAVKVRDVAERAARNRFVQAMVFVPLFFVLVDVLNLPVAVYSQWLALKYEQSIQGWGSWLWDWTKGELISFVIGIVLVWILFTVIRRAPRRWWFAFWLAALPILVFLLFLAPLVIAPLFNEFRPLAETQPALVARLEQVVARGGLEIPRERMFEMIASEKVKTVNAYVTGIGASKRVVIWDTTLEKMTPEQTLFVFGHEMGHYVLHHIWKGIAFAAVLLLVFLYLGYHGLQRLLRRRGERWGIRGQEDWAALPVLLLLFSVFGFLFAPVFNTYSRAMEHEADIYGLEVIHGVVPDSGRVAGEAFQILGEIALSDPSPHPFIEFWLYDHPAVVDRVVFAQTYDPWSQGQEPKFIK
jgi:Zn-dependent protease with chaperone function